MKSINEIHTFETKFDDMNEKELKSLIKQSAIEDIRELENILKTPRYSGKHGRFVAGLKAKIEYIKQKFNITEEEMKEVVKSE